MRRRSSRKWEFRDRLYQRDTDLFYRWLDIFCLTASFLASFLQEAQVMLTNPRDAFRGQSRSRDGFNGRSLVHWPTRPLGGWVFEAPGPRGPGRLNFGLQLQSPDWNLNLRIYDLFKLETSTLIRCFVLSEF